MDNQQPSKLDYNIFKEVIIISIFNVPIKLYEFDLYKNKFIPIMINQEFDIDEEWKDIYFKDKKSGYYISNIGRVKNFNEEILPLYYDKDGYTRFSLYIPKNNKIYKNKEKIAYPYKVHRAVAEAFVVNPDPTEYSIVLHKNDIKDCNIYVNLMWGNYQMNMDDKKTSNRSFYLKGEEKSDSKFKEKDIREICDCLFIHNLSTKNEIIKFLGKEKYDNVYIKSYKNLIKNVKSGHCWKYILDEYIEKYGNKI